MDVAIPSDALVVLVGPSGAGKTTYARAHFAPTEVVSSDECRALVSDDETNQDATPAAFRVLHTIVRERLRLGRRTVVDATNVRADKRATLLKLARKLGRPSLAIVFEQSDATYLERNRARPDRSIPEDAVRAQIAKMRQTLRTIDGEGFDHVHRLTP